MRVELPPKAPGRWHAVTVERHQVGCTDLFTVTVQRCAGKPARRVWYADEAFALVYALNQAELHQLPLFDHRDGGAD